MQQTEKRGFNIIETSDPFLPDALNDNTRKLEAALDALTAYADAGDAAVVSRVVELEKFHFACGVYKGNGVERLMNVGFRPLMVVLQLESREAHIIIEGNYFTDSTLEFVENGFFLTLNCGFNVKNATYVFFAVGKDE